MAQTCNAMLERQWKIAQASIPDSLEYLKKFQANDTFFHKQNV